MRRGALFIAIECLGRVEMLGASKGHLQPPSATCRSVRRVFGESEVVTDSVTDLGSFPAKEGPNGLGRGPVGPGPRPVGLGLGPFGPGLGRGPPLDICGPPVLSDLAQSLRI